MPYMLQVPEDSEDLTKVRFTEDDPTGSFMAYPTLSTQQRQQFDEIVATEEGRGMLEAVAKCGMRLQMKRMVGRQARRGERVSAD